MSIIDSRILSVGAGNFHTQTLTRPVPTVFIALGGSGKDVVMRLRKRFFDRFQTKQPGYAQFVFVDTDDGGMVPYREKKESFTELVPDQNEKVEVPITPAQFNKTFAGINAKVNADHLAWLNKDMERITPHAVTKGAGTYRPMGRLAFFLNYTAIRATIERQVTAALRFAADNPGKAEDNLIEVVIVSSLAGGTGAGMFIDVAYLVQDILNQPNTQNLRSKNVTLVCFLPGVFEDRGEIYERLQQNAFAAFMELEHYGTPRTGDELFLGRQKNGRPGQESGANSNWTGFMANWGDGRRFIRGPGWDTCFLIDNRNDLDPNSPLSRREVFQMAADYLFLDFENHDFATAKRSARCNLVQFKDKIKETWVRRPDHASDNLSIYEGNNSVYATQNGCRFSSFGLAEIYFDAEKIYQIAAYQLALCLVRNRWLKPADTFNDTQYTNWAKEELLQPRPGEGREAPPSFLPEALMRRLLTDATSSHLDRLKKDLDALADVDPEEGMRQLSTLLRTHAASLAEGRDEHGAARQTLRENLARLSGDPSNLGEMRDRLRRLAARHCARHGVRVTLRLLQTYRDALQKVRERAGAQAKAMPPDDRVLLARLAEAEKVPWPVRDTALSIEFPRARDAVGMALRLRYDKAAAGTIDKLLVGLIQYIGSSDQAMPAELAGHGTLFQGYTRAQDILLGIAARLEDRFRVTHKDEHRTVDEKAATGSQQPGHAEQGERVLRRHSLAPKWDEETYRRRIDEVLVAHTEIKSAETRSDAAEKPTDSFTFDWNRFEAFALQVFQGLPRGDLGEVKSVDHLCKYCIRHDLENDRGFALLAELLAEACKVVLQGKNGKGKIVATGFQFRDEGKGNAIDLLVRQNGWTDVIDKMVRLSMPYIQTTDPARVSNDFSPAYSNLYSQKQGESNASATNAGRVFQAVSAAVATRAAYIPNQAARHLDNPFAAENSTIILVREMTGFPLQFYAHLDSLHRSYEKTITKDGLGADETHINYQESSESLPDITLLEAPTYALIRDHVTFVIRAIILGTINWREDVLKVSVPDLFGPRHTEMRLGKRLHRAIKYACDKERVRKHLVKVWHDWANQASPRDWACLYASGRMSWAQLSPERDVRQDGMMSPLRNCYEGIVKLAEGRLQGTEEGKLWLNSLEHDAYEDRPHDDLARLPDQATFAQQLVRCCLRRLNDEIPIYQILADKVSDVPAPV